MKLSVLLPVKDQSAKLLANLKEHILPYFDHSGVVYDVLICYDASNEEERRIMEKGVKELPAQVRLLPYEDHRGKGHNVKKAATYSDADYVLFMDADLATDLSIFDLMKADLGKVDCLIASRDLKESVYRIKQPLLRRINHVGCRKVVAFKFHMKGIRDTQCGYKCLRTALAKEYAKRSIIDGFAFDVEMLYFLFLNGYSIKEYPAIWSDDPDSSVSGVFKTAKRFYGDLSRIKKNKAAYIMKPEERPC